MKILKNKIYRNSNVVEKDEFNKFFSDFDDGKKIMNCGGFRPKAKMNCSPDITNSAFIVLVSNFGEAEWPDKVIDDEVIYYGDNRKVNNNILDTKFKGNILLEYINKEVEEGLRGKIPPILMFKAFKDKVGSCMKFIGLLVPSTEGDFLKKEIKKVEEGSFSNFRSRFKVLPTKEVDVEWLKDLVRDIEPIDSEYCPLEWKEFVYNNFNINNEVAITSVGDEDNDDDMIEIEVNVSDLKGKVPSFDYKYKSSGNGDREKLEKRKKEIGDQGEELVMEHEKKMLLKAKLHELAKNVRWVSKNDGDSMGYDVESFFQDGTPKKIEVKATTTNINEPFNLSDRELVFAERNKENWILYRVLIKNDKIKTYYKLTYDEFIARVTLKPTDYVCFIDNREVEN